MATKDNEHFWRLYLYLNEGVSFLSKDIIVRKLDVSGNDLISQLRKHEVQLKKNDNLDSMDLDSLFPANGETDMDTWNANMYLSVILTLFQASLKAKERRMLRSVQHVLEDLRERQDGTKIDHLMYEEHVENLEEAFLVLTFNDDSVMRITEIKKVYLDEPLNSDSLQNKIAKMEFPRSIKQKLENFLETIYSTYTINDVCNENHFGTFKNTENSDKKHKDIGQDINFDEKQTEGAVVIKSINETNAEVENDEIDKKHEDIGQDTDFDKKQTKGAIVINSIKDNNAEVGSDEIGACGTNEDSEHSSDGIGAVVTAADVENEIVSIANKPQTDEETRSVARQLDMQRFEKSVRKDDLETFISEELNTWETEHVNIAVIGRSGVGKSRFINAIRGCEEGDPEYAEIDVIETTMSVKNYPDPKNSSVIYWDLPGIGTDDFPEEKYIKMKEINFFGYDLYLIVSADRFMKAESFLAKTLEESGKTFLFLRTKADANAEEFSDFKSVLEKIRKNCIEKLSLTKIEAKDVYLISSKKVDHKLLEFDRLVERIVDSLPVLKKETLLKSLRFNTKTLIKEKRTQLISRAKNVSWVSATLGAVPLPGLSFCVDSKLILNELDVYRDTLLITEKNLENLAEKTGIDVNELKSKYNLKSFTLFNSAKGVAQFSTFVPLLKKIAMSEVAENTAKLIPVVGTAIGAGISYYTTYKFLTSTLEILVEDSEKILDILLEKTGSSIF